MKLEESVKYYPVTTQEILKRIVQLSGLRANLDTVIKQYYEDATRVLVRGSNITGMKLQKGRAKNVLKEDAYESLIFILSYEQLHKTIPKSLTELKNTLSKVLDNKEEINRIMDSITVTTYGDAKAALV